MAKSCVLCGSSERDDAVTCSKCGEATWADGCTSEAKVGSVSNFFSEPEKPAAPARKRSK